MARICSSNWLAGQASIVQCPELCGRGAISLASTVAPRVDEHLHGEQPDQIERVGDTPGDRLSLSIDRLGYSRRGEGDVEDVAPVAILHRVECRVAAILRRGRRPR